MANKTVNAFLILYLLTRRSALCRCHDWRAILRRAVNTGKMEVFNFRKVSSPRASPTPFFPRAAPWWIIRCLREGSSNGRETTMMLQTNDADQLGLSWNAQRLSFDGPVDEIEFRGCARQESGTRRMKVAGFVRPAEQKYLPRRSADRRFCYWRKISAIHGFRRRTQGWGRGLVS